MTRAEALARLRRHEGELRAMGAGALYLFGSTARDEAREDSDVDVFIEVAADFPAFSLFDLAGIYVRLEEVIEGPVDVATREGLHPRLRPQIEAEAVQVF